MQMPPDVPDTATHAPDLEWVSACNLPTPWAVFQLHAFVETGTGKEHLAITLGDLTSDEPVLARLHSECLTGDALFSQRCDCGAQLEQALKTIATAGRGLILYLRQEGRGIGLANKIRAYQLQDQGADTVQANQDLGFEADQRDYRLCAPMLQHLQVAQLRLMTNNPHKIAALENMGFKVVERLPIVVRRNAYNQHYLETKAARLGHLLPAASDTESVA